VRRKDNVRRDFPRLFAKEKEIFIGDGNVIALLSMLHVDSLQISSQTWSFDCRVTFIQSIRDIHL